MLAFIGNLAPTELILIAVVAVLIFGKRLPEVAARAYTELRKIRTNLDHLRRETGIDDELRTIQHSVRDASREASSAIQLDPPSAPTQSRSLASADTAPAPEVAGEAAAQEVPRAEANEGTAIVETPSSEHASTLPVADRREPQE